MWLCRQADRQSAAAFVYTLGMTLQAQSADTRGHQYRACWGNIAAEMLEFASFHGSVHTLGPNTTPPPGLSGVLLEPCRAFPVPFCAYGFLPPPLTSALVFVLAVPCKASVALRLWRVYCYDRSFCFQLTALAFCLTVTRYLCTRPLAVLRAATFRARSCEPDDEPSKVLTSMLAGFATMAALQVKELLLATSL